jgi:hypothetical protein
VSVAVPTTDAGAVALAEAEPRLTRGEEPSASWYTWRHKAAAEAARDVACPRALALIFDWPLMQSVNDREAYEQALRAKYGRVYL